MSDTMDEALDNFLRNLADAVSAEWKDQMVAKLPPEYLRAYQDHATVSQDSEGILCKLTGKIPNFVEHGLGPKLGEDAPYDTRINALKDRDHRAVQVAPNVFRTMSWKGKPWMHPGFRQHNLLKLVQSRLDEIIAGMDRGGHAG